MGPVDQEFGKDSGDGLSMFHDYCNFSWESLEAGDGSLPGPWDHPELPALPGLAGTGGCLTSGTSADAAIYTCPLLWLLRLPHGLLREGLPRGSKAQVHDFIRLVLEVA